MDFGHATGHRHRHGGGRRLGEVKHTPAKRRKLVGRRERGFTIKVAVGTTDNGGNYWARACAVRGTPSDRQAMSKCFYGTSYKSPTQAVGSALKALVNNHRDPNAFYRKHGLQRRRLGR